MSNEVGEGVHPETAAGLRFRDLLGHVNQRVAAACETVVLMVAGIPLAVKATGRASVSDLSRLLGSIAAPARDGEAAARHHLDSLTKPPGSLGRLEEIALRLAILCGRAPAVTRPVIFTFAADHGVVAEGVSAYPQIVTAQMVENFTRGGAAVNVLARQAGARVVVANFGVASPLGRSPDLVECPIGPGTANIAVGPAMTRSTRSARSRPGRASPTRRWTRARISWRRARWASATRPARA